jgi:protein transport protein SEC24
MAAPQGGYPPPQDGFAQQPQQPYAEQQQYMGSSTSPPPPPQDAAAGSHAPAHGLSHGGRKKRAYAGQAFEFGQGQNAALGGQPTAGGAYGYTAPMQPQGYPQPAYPGQQAVPQPTPDAFAPPEPMSAGGYQPPMPGYPSAPVPPAPGIAQVTQQMGQMNVADQPARGQRAAPLNQLYPTDLLTQPFNVAELEYPPPPIVLPPNVSVLLV